MARYILGRQGESGVQVSISTKKDCMEFSIYFARFLISLFEKA